MAENSETSSSSDGSGDQYTGANTAAEIHARFLAVKNKTDKEARDLLAVLTKLSENERSTANRDGGTEASGDGDDDDDDDHTSSEETSEGEDLDPRAALRALREKLAAQDRESAIIEKGMIDGAINADEMERAELLRQLGDIGTRLGPGDSGKRDGRDGATESSEDDDDDDDSDDDDDDDDDDEEDYDTTTSDATIGGEDYDPRAEFEKLRQKLAAQDRESARIEGALNSTKTTTSGPEQPHGPGPSLDDPINKEIAAIEKQQAKLTRLLVDIATKLGPGDPGNRDGDMEAPGDDDDEDEEDNDTTTSEETIAGVKYDPLVELEKLRQKLAAQDRESSRIEGDEIKARILDVKIKTDKDTRDLLAIRYKLLEEERSPPNRDGRDGDDDDVDPSSEETSEGEDADPRAALRALREKLAAQDRASAIIEKALKPAKTTTSHPEQPGGPGPSSSDGQTGGPGPLSPHDPINTEIGEMEKKQAELLRQLGEIGTRMGQSGPGNREERDGATESSEDDDDDDDDDGDDGDDTSSETTIGGENFDLNAEVMKLRQKLAAQEREAARFKQGMINEQINADEMERAELLRQLGDIGKRLGKNTAGMYTRDGATESATGTDEDESGETKGAGDILSKLEKLRQKIEFHDKETARIRAELNKVEAQKKRESRATRPLHGRSVTALTLTKENELIQSWVLDFQEKLLDNPRFRPPVMMTKLQATAWNQILEQDKDLIEVESEEEVYGHPTFGTHPSPPPRSTDQYATAIPMERKHPGVVIHDVTDEEDMKEYEHLEGSGLLEDVSDEYLSAVSDAGDYDQARGYSLDWERMKDDFGLDDLPPALIYPPRGPKHPLQMPVVHPSPPPRRRRDFKTSIPMGDKYKYVIKYESTDEDEGTRPLRAPGDTSTPPWQRVVGIQDVTDEEEARKYEYFDGSGPDVLEELVPSSPLDQSVLSIPNIPPFGGPHGGPGSDESYESPETASEFETSPESSPESETEFRAPVFPRVFESPSVTPRRPAVESQVLNVPTLEEFLLEAAERRGGAQLNSDNCFTLPFAPVLDSMERFRLITSTRSREVVGSDIYNDMTRLLDSLQECNRLAGELFAKSGERTQVFWNLTYRVYQPYYEWLTPLLELYHHLQDGYYDKEPMSHSEYILARYRIRVLIDNWDKRPPASEFYKIVGNVTSEVVKERLEAWFYGDQPPPVVPRHVWDGGDQDGTVEFLDPIEMAKEKARQEAEEKAREEAARLEALRLAQEQEEARVEAIRQHEMRLQRAQELAALAQLSQYYQARNEHDDKMAANYASIATSSQTTVKAYAEVLALLIVMLHANDQRGGGKGPPPGGYGGPPPGGKGGPPPGGKGGPPPGGKAGPPPGGKGGPPPGGKGGPPPGSSGGPPPGGSGGPPPGGKGGPPPGGSGGPPPGGKGGPPPGGSGGPPPGGKGGPPPGGSGGPPPGGKGGPPPGGSGGPPPGGSGGPPPGGDGGPAPGSSGGPPPGGDGGPEDPEEFLTDEEDKIEKDPPFVPINLEDVKLKYPEKTFHSNVNCPKPGTHGYIEWLKKLYEKVLLSERKKQEVDMEEGRKARQKTNAERRQRRREKLEAFNKRKLARNKK